MAYYYKVNDLGSKSLPALEGVKCHKENSPALEGPCIQYDFSKHVLIELLDNVTPEAKLWKELGLFKNENIVHKRLLVDPHRINCRRAIVVCVDSEQAKELAERLSQAKIANRAVCAVVIQELLSDVCLFENQIKQYGDKRSQHQLVYVTDLNRCRAPAGLVEYLREKFSPFGTILSIFVSEDEDGYAYPEGVIRFAHLSEAFAAELAFDQSVVAMERLSVSTHHNILLSQCDLRARLREAQFKKNNESYSTFASRQSDVQNDVFHSGMYPANPVSSHPTENINTSSLLRINGTQYPSDSAELADVLENSCKGNLVDCLKGINMCSENSTSNETVDNARSESGSSVDNQDSPNHLQANQSASHNGSYLISPSKNKTRSSRIMGWLTDIPYEDDLSNDHLGHNVSGNNRTLINPEGSGQLNQNVGSPLSPGETASSGGSFITCENYHSIIPSSPASTIRADGTSSPESLLDIEMCKVEEQSNSESNMYVTVPLHNPSDQTLPLTLSSNKTHKTLQIKRKKMSKNMSGMSQWANSSNSVSEHERTTYLPSVPRQECSVVLESLPELNELALTLYLEKSHELASEHLFSAQLPPSSVSSKCSSYLSRQKGGSLDEASVCSTKLAECLPVRKSPEVLLGHLCSLQIPQTSEMASSSKRQKSEGSQSDTSSIAHSTNSTETLPVRRSSRRTTQQADAKSHSFNGTSRNHGNSKLKSFKK